MSLRPGDVVWVNFPFVEQGQLKSRPAVVLNASSLGPSENLLWTAMITGSRKAAWPGDIAIEDLDLAGLPIASSIRVAKLATVDRSTARFVGRISASELSRTLGFVRAALA